MNNQLPGPLFYFCVGVIWTLCAEALIYLWLVEILHVF